MHSVLVIGGDGLIGRSLTERLRENGTQVFVSSRRETHGPNLFHLDLAGVNDTTQLPDADIAFICAAVSRFADCDADPANARRINVDGPAVLVRKLLARDTRVIFLSSNAVFDGRDEAPDECAVPSPSSTYGRLKAEAESVLASLAADTNGSLAIVRLTKVVDRLAPLLRDWLSSWREGRAITAYSDMTVSPVSLRYVVDGLLVVANISDGGIFHLSGNQEVSYAQFAVALADAIGVDSRFISISKRDQNGTDLISHNGLAMLRTTALLGLHPQHLEHVVDEMASGAVQL